MDSIDPAAIPEFDELLVNPFGPLLWDHLRACLRGDAEADYVHGALCGGDEDAVARNEAVRVELRALLEILGDVRRDGPSPRGACAARSMAGGSGEASPQVPSLRPAVARLTPASLAHANRELLEQQVRALLESAQRRPSTPDGAAATSASGSPVPPPTTAAAPAVVVLHAREKMIADFVTNNSQRPGSSSVRQRRPGSSAAASSVSRPPSASAPPTSAADVDGGGASAQLAPLQAQLRFDRIHEVAPQLRRMLDDEHHALLDDVAFVRSAIDDAITWARFEEPTPSELRALASKLSSREEDAAHAAKILQLPAKRKVLPALAGLPVSPAKGCS